MQAASAASNKKIFLVRQENNDKMLVSGPLYEEPLQVSIL
jgi:hypothetical protein